MDSSTKQCGGEEKFKKNLIFKKKIGKNLICEKNWGKLNFQNKSLGKTFESNFMKT